MKNGLKTVARWTCLFSAGLLVSLTPQVWANDPCDHDRSKVCGNVTPGEGRLHDCMMQNLDKLSPACQKNASKADQLNRSMEDICQHDISQFCAQHTNSGRSRLIQCLQEKHAQLRHPCQKAFDDYKALGYRVRQ
jgi:hypothetical protein